MYGDKHTQAFCCNCKEVTRHEYRHFGKSEVTKPEKVGWFKAIIQSFANAPTGDYRCIKCGTNLHTPDYLD
ncbi:hypothetical protein A8L45_07790 [Veronia pacifica]|uniref:Uncharacterized protein n=1 Tax=Veronia pacifica TaxID=1080227 RepID=A0A1C3EL46_9GAMM|nr:hypothetical protein [Veronia pacifica]ODA33945.1 hypothetical protein A8L45_07790 [Veronia pacifica]